MGNQGTFLAAGAEAATQVGLIPGFGAEASYTVPAATRLRLICVWTQITHTVTFRTGLRILRGGNEIYSVMCPANIGAGTNQTLVYGAGIGYHFTTHNNAIPMPLPVGLILRSGDIITTQTTTLQGGDLFTKLFVTGDFWLDPT